MKKQFLIICSIAYFTLLAPPNGLILFWLYSITVYNFGQFSFPWKDILYSVVEFWIPALIGGVLFAIAAFPMGNLQPFMKSRLSRLVVAASAFFIVFLVPIIQKMLAGHKINRTLFLLPILGGITGAVLGWCFPKWILPIKNKS